jgi:hypothetical protein
MQIIRRSLATNGTNRTEDRGQEEAFSNKKVDIAATTALSCKQKGDASLIYS